MTDFFTTHRTFDQSQFIVLCDFGRGVTHPLEGIFHPTDTRKQIIADIVSGQHENIVSVIEFNPVEGWSRDITDEIRDEVEQANIARKHAFDGVSYLRAAE